MMIDIWIYKFPTEQIHIIKKKEKRKKKTLNKR